MYSRFHALISGIMSVLPELAGLYAVSIHMGNQSMIVKVETKDQLRVSQVTLGSKVPPPGTGLFRRVRFGRERQAGEACRQASGNVGITPATMPGPSLWVRLRNSRGACSAEKMGDLSSSINGG